MRPITRYLTRAVAAAAWWLTGTALVACGGPLGPTLVDVEGTVLRSGGSAAAGRSVAIGAAPVAGTLAAAVGPGRLGVVCVESIERPVAGCDELSPGESAFDVVVGWRGATSLAATVRAIVYEVDADQLPTAIASMGVATVTLAVGDALAGVGVPLTAITSGTVVVELHVAPPASPSSTTFTVALPTAGGGPIVSMSTLEPVAPRPSWPAPLHPEAPRARGTLPVETASCAGETASGERPAPSRGRRRDPHRSRRTPCPAPTPT